MKRARQSEKPRGQRRVLAEHLPQTNPTLPHTGHKYLIGAEPPSYAFEQPAAEAASNPDPANEREIYESVFENPLPPAPPWYGYVDDATNQVVQDAAARHRNFIAATGTGPIEPPYVPPKGTGQVASNPDVIRKEANGSEIKSGQVSGRFIERRLLEYPDDIRAAARNLSEALNNQAKELRKSKPNEPGQLAQYESLIAFFEHMAAGLADLADALDRAFSSATGSPSPEPVFLGKAADIAHRLQGMTQQWLEETGTAVINVPVRIGVLCAGIGFLHWLGADSFAAVGALGWLVRGEKPKARKPSNKKKKKGAG